MIPGHNQNPYKNIFSNNQFKCNNCGEYLHWKDDNYYLVVKYGLTAMLFLVLAFLITSLLFGLINTYTLLILSVLLITVIASVMKWSNDSGHLVKVVKCHNEVKDDSRKETKKKFS